MTFETLADIVTSSSTMVDGPIRALDPGASGNLPDDTSLTIAPPLDGVSSAVIARNLTGGTDTETDEQLRARILQRIQNPPMGGSAADYVAWALAVPGVTRAWAAPEQGPGTITVRFLMDDLRAEDDGWPTPADVDGGRALHRPEAAGHGHGLLRPRADQTVHRYHDRQPGAGHGGSAGRDRGEPSSDAVRDGSARANDFRGVGFVRNHELAERASRFELVTTDDYVMPSLGHMAVVGTILYT